MNKAKTGDDSWCYVESVLPLVAIPFLAFFGLLTVVLLMRSA